MDREDATIEDTAVCYAQHLFYLDLKPKRPLMLRDGKYMRRYPVLFISLYTPSELLDHAPSNVDRLTARQTKNTASLCA